MRKQECMPEERKPEEARQRALRLFGNRTLMKERIREMDTLGWIERLRQDLRYAFRMLRKSPGFTAAVVVSIALGIAANTTVFSIVNALLLGSLPITAPERLLKFNEADSFSYPDYVDYRDQTQDVFEGVSAHFPLVPASLGGGGEPERILCKLITGNYLS